MRLKLTKELYHRPDCSHPIFSQLLHAAETMEETPEKVESQGYKPCNECFPERYENEAERSL